MLRYVNRILAAMYVIGWLAVSTSYIGAAPSTKPLSWEGAWTFAIVIAMAVFFGWFARKETEA